MTTNTLRPGLPPLPPHMRHLPIDDRGFPVPFFVSMVDGKPDHRMADPKKLLAALQGNLCWLCGQPLGVFKSFVAGPMCALNRVSAEPPSHRDCARYAVTACPFLTRPHAHRREAGLPEARHEPGGVFLKRNPGVAMIWTTKSFKLYRPRGGGLIFDMGPPDSIEWYAEGRPAELAEVEDGIASGLPALLEVAKADGADAVRELDGAAAVLIAEVRAQFAGADDAAP